MVCVCVCVCDRIVPISFKVARIKFGERGRARARRFARLYASRSELLFTPLREQTAQSIDSDSSRRPWSTRNRIAHRSAIRA